VLTTKTAALTDYNLGTLAVGYLPCYCEQDFSGNYNEIFATPAGNKTLCVDVLYDKLYANGMGALLGLVLAFVSSAFDMVFFYLNMIEKNTDRNKEIASRIIKIFFWKYFNSGVLIIFVNNRASFFGYDVGQFDDFTPAWFQEIGYSILLTMLLQCISILCISFAIVMLRKFKQCRDRGCGLKMLKPTNKPNTKVLTHEEYET
jgi:hypothetical protein